MFVRSGELRDGEVDQFVGMLEDEVGDALFGGPQGGVRPFDADEASRDFTGSTCEVVILTPIASRYGAGSPRNCLARAAFAEQMALERRLDIGRSPVFGLLEIRGEMGLEPRIVRPPVVVDVGTIGSSTRAVAEARPSARRDRTAECVFWPSARV